MSGSHAKEVDFKQEKKPTAKTYTNPIISNVADPFVLFEDGTYYLYATGDSGIPAWTSKDLVNWERQGYVFHKTQETWTQRNYWSPEVFKVGADYYLTVNASPNKGSELPFNEHLCIFKGKSPLGPFVEWKTPFYKPEPPDEAIDQSFFFDDDGKVYLVFTQVTVGRNDVRIVKLKENLCEFDGEPVIAIISTDSWESMARNNHKVAEGATMLKHGGYYYLLYTANDFRDPHYSMGYATSKNPLGPWEKYAGNPILCKTDQVHGPGNGMVVFSPDGQERFLVYHVHCRPGQVSPRHLAIDRVHFEKGKDDGPDILVIDGPTSTPQPMPSGVK